MYVSVPFVLLGHGDHNRPLPKEAAIVSLYFRDSYSFFGKLVPAINSETCCDQSLYISVTFHKKMSR